MKWLICLFFLSPLVHALDFTVTEDEELGDAVTYKTVIINGVIEVGDAKRLEKILKPQLKTKKRTVFLMTSPGGVLEEVSELAKVILDHAQKSAQTLGKPDLFAINEECGSACSVLTTVLTQKRDPKNLEMFIHDSSQFLFHSPSRCVEDGKEVDLKEQAEAQKAFERMEESYLKGGISKSWWDSHVQRLKSPTGFTVTAKTLCAAQAQVIPQDSCVSVSSDRFSELIVEVYEKNGTLIESPEIKSKL